MRADRLISLLLYMQGRPRVTASEIAQELEVSVATARRDLEALSSAGIPVYPQPGRHGGWSLLGGARTDLTGLTAAESRALFSVIGTSRDVPERAGSALRKLVRALPSSFRDDAEAAAQAVVVDAASWGEAAGSERADVDGAASVLETVRAAIIDRRRIEFDYAGPARPASSRTVDPWGLVDKDGAWYLVAGTPRGRRTYRLDRLRSLRPTDEHFDRPSGFDLGTAWREVVEEVEARRATISCTVRLPSRFVFVLEDQFGRHCERMDDSSGTSTVRLSASSILDLARTLAGWGGGLAVLEPSALRAELARIGAELVAASDDVDGEPDAGSSVPR